jgi:hypothetical protein
MGVANISGILSDIFRFIYRAIATAILSLFIRKKDEEEAGEENDEELEKQKEKEKEHQGIISGGRAKSAVGDSRQKLTENDQTEISDLSDLNQNENDNEDEEEDKEKSKDEDEDKLNVPLLLIFSVIGAYLYSGSVIFSNIEQSSGGAASWSQIGSAYWNFVSMSTMGEKFCNQSLFWG